MVWPSCITCTPSSLATHSTWCFLKLVFGGGTRVPRIPPGTDSEACYILCLQAFRTLLHFEFHRLTFIERLVTVHHDGGEVYENIFSCLALDESVALRSVEPLHRSLFLHCLTSRAWSGFSGPS